MTSIPLRRTIGTLTALISTAAYAHPGHGQEQTGSTLWHFLLEPMHVGEIALLVSAVVAAVMFWDVARRLYRDLPQMKRSHL